ncbi:hypothetical protein MRP92_04840 [Flavobacterium covae]|uniref:hypothetical protein n=1 Tax=Flavobacterium covae TaxID=2906076 RepID=UPI001FB7261D|nr:hypothetical protein [Flavobacterium covae]MCJ1806239.1 hypothetical protein [Flavobacterium covae]
MIKAIYLKTLPENCEIVFKGGSYNFKDLTTNELVGLVEVKNNFLEFGIYRKGLKTKIKGKQVFNSLILHLKFKKVPFSGMKGLWGSKSDNTNAFNVAISNGFTSEEAAFETWTGKLALEQGFRRVQINKLIPDVPPYTSIEVTFY